MAVDTNVTQFLENAGAVITSTTEWFTGVLGIFMEPPLVIFLGIGIFASVVRIASKLVRARR